VMRHNFFLIFFNNNHCFRKKNFFGLKTFFFLSLGFLYKQVHIYFFKSKGLKKKIADGDKLLLLFLHFLLKNGDREGAKTEKTQKKKKTTTKNHPFFFFPLLFSVFNDEFFLFDGDRRLLLFDSTMILT
jgi:hypothetical protein